MSFLHRMLASVGIGAAQVDTVLEKATFEPGEQLRGVVRVKGGQVEQQIDTIYISLMTQYVREVDDKKVFENAELGKYRVSEPFRIGAGEQRELPFSFPIPLHTPLSVGRTPIWLKTGLDIKSAVDPTDADRIEVTPNKEIRTILDAVAQLGFRLREATCEYAPRLGYSVFVQELEYVPVSGPFRGRLDELEVIVAPQNDYVDVFMQIDRKASGLSGLFAEAMEIDETNVRCRITQATLDRGAGAVAAELELMIRRFS